MTGAMHTTLEASLFRPSTTFLLRHSPPPSSLNPRHASLFTKPGNNINPRDRSFQKASVRCFASRKDRRDAAAGEEEFKPDIPFLRSSFSKRFPGGDGVADFEWDSGGSDDDDDGVEVKSFKSGGNYGRAAARPPPRNPVRNYDREDRNSNNFGIRGRPSREESSSRYDDRRRAPQGGGYNEGYRAEFPSDSRNQRGPRGEEVDRSSRYRSSSEGYRAEFSEGRNQRRPRGEEVDRSSGYRGGSSSRGSSRGGPMDRVDSGREGFRVRPERGGAFDRAENYSRSSGEPTRGRDSGRTSNFRDGGARPAADPSKPVRNGREPYGGGEWSKDTPIFDDEADKKKKKEVIEPVSFTSPMSKSPHVAILGGGMSGLVCALTLEGHGVQSTVFDTGKHGLGGRMGTRHVEVGASGTLVFDHAAQFFTATDPLFKDLVDRWISEGSVKKWEGNIGILRAGGQYTDLPPATRYVGTNGMRSLADSMLLKSKLINVKRPCWISRMDAVNGRWNLTENRKPQGEFDAVVIAHNGKCANRLLSTAHVPLIARQMKRLGLSSIWALLAAFEDPLPLPGGQILDGAFVEGVDSLSWVGNNSRKLLEEKTPECWTFFSTAEYGKRNKVPQESIPAAKGQKVKQEMLRGVEAALGLEEDSLPNPIYTRLQLWGAALPTNTPAVPCIFDAQGRVGICGDWLLGSSLEAAALSGIALADHIVKYRDEGDQEGEDFSIGLQQSFSEVGGHDIGQFPGSEKLPQFSAPEVPVAA